MAFIIIFSPLCVMATDVTCPVCMRSFPDWFTHCPEDGAALTVLETDKDSGVPEADKETDADTTEKKTGKKTGKYKRDTRDRVIIKTAAPSDSKKVYSDRESRIPAPRRGMEAALKRKREEAKRLRIFNERDDLLRKKFFDSRQKFLKNKNDAYLKLLQKKTNLKRSGLIYLYSRRAPFVSIGMRAAWMKKTNQPGVVIGPRADINFIRTRLRMGISSHIGFKKQKHDNELLFLESFYAGIQKPWRFSPYIVARAGIGVSTFEKSNEKSFNFTKSYGVEAGIDCWVNSKIAISPFAGYTRIVTNNTRWNSFTAGISTGF